MPAFSKLLTATFVALSMTSAAATPQDGRHGLTAFAADLTQKFTQAEHKLDDSTYIFGVFFFL